MSSCAYSENEHKNVVISSMHGLPHLSLQHFSFALECNEYNLWTEGGELESFWEQIKTAIREVAPTSPMRRWIDSTELACIARGSNFLKTNILQELSLNGCAPLLSDQIEALVITQSKSLARLKVLNLHSLIANLVSRVCEALDRARPELLPSSKVGKEWPILKLCVDFEEQHMHAWLERISRWKYIDGSNAICTNLKRLCYEIRKSRD
uniref:Uncharacterized protein n=1 Tax=Ditylenchus dipsaci TaxID=166011 RepID=A0A915E8W1_9BILA